MTMVASMKRKKGKKKEAAAAPDLSRILGYTPPNDVPAESDRCGSYRSMQPLLTNGLSVQQGATANIVGRFAASRLEEGLTLD
jgi:hypothetical protein